MTSYGSVRYSQFKRLLDHRCISHIQTNKRCNVKYLLVSTSSLFNDADSKLQEMYNKQGRPGL